MMSLTRRVIAKVSGAAAFIFLVGQRRSAKALGSATYGFDHLFESHAAANALGAAYVKQYHTSSEELAIQLSDKLSTEHEAVVVRDGVIQSPMPLADLKSLFSSVVKRDFENGNTLNVDGWVLSKTECELCGLVFLSGH